MPDLTAATTALALFSTSSASLKNAIDIGQKLKGWVKGKNDPEAQQMVSDFLSALLSLQGDVIDLQQECTRLFEENRVAKDHLKYRAKLIRRDAYYEFSEPEEGYGKGPFCLQCTDLNGFPIGVPVDRNGHFHCSKCGSSGYLEGKAPPAVTENNLREEFRRRR